MAEGGATVARLLLVALGLATALGPRSACALDNGLGRTPPLGFNTWNYFGCEINETVVRNAAERLVALGLADAGYSYLNVDDCWQLRRRDGRGRLQADPLRFPSGMAALAAALRDRGLRFGIYSDAGPLTCAGFPGSLFHEAVDAQQFADWGVDYLKYDNCFALSADVVWRYTRMRDALNATGRPIYFSLCSWGVDQPWRWGPAVGNSWRTDADISPTWDAVLRSLDNGAAGLARFAGPPPLGWNDPDMLEIGNGKLTREQQRSHFALWALVKAPLLIGTNLEQLSATSLAILKAKEVIAVNQDSLGVAGDIIWKEGPAEVWAGPLEGDQRAVVLFNRHWAGDPANIRVTWRQLGYEQPEGSGPSGFRAVVRDLYAERDLGVFEGGFTARLRNYDCAALRVTPAPAPSADLGGGWGGEGGGGAWALALRRRLRARAAGAGTGAARPPQRARTTETVWRPWHGAEAAALQAHMRAAAQEARQSAAAAGGGRAGRGRGSSSSLGALAPS